MTPLPDDDDLMAAEYVLGTLDLEARALAERRLRDPAFAAAVLAWEKRLSGLDGEFSEAPAPDLLPRIEARLFPQPAPRRQGFRLWAASGLAALAVVAYLALTPVAPQFTAVILAENGLEYDASLTSGQLRVVHKAGDPALAGQAHELWLIVGDAAPVSLGVLGEDTVVALAEAPEGAVLAISLEPEGGSPTGQPTGPVLALGKLQKA